MKKLMLIVSLFLLVNLAGCGSEAEWNVQITKPLVYGNGQESTFEINITEGDKPVTGVSATARIEMPNMNHGALNLRLEEGKKGYYSGEAKPTMSGNYIVILKLKKDGRTYERELEMEIKK